MNDVVRSSVPAPDDYRALAENIPTLCWMAEADGWITWYNRRWYAFTGTTPADMAGWGWQSVHHPDRLPDVLARWQACVANGDPFDMTFPLRAADGTYRPFLTRVEPVRDAQGRVARWFGVNIDISDQVAAETALRIEHDRSRNTLEMIREGFLLLDDGFRIQQINGEALRMERRPASALLGRTHWEAYPGSEHSELGRLYKTALRDGVPVMLDHHYVWEVGHEAWLEMRAYPAADRMSLAVFYRDVTERRRSEAASRASEEQFRVFAQAVPNHVWAAHADGGLYWFNDQVYAYCGVAQGALDGAAWTAAIHPDDVVAAGAAWAQALAGGEVYETEFRIRRFDGSHRWFLVRAEPIRDEAGTVVRWVGTNTDIDDHKRVSAELARLNETLEQRVEARTQELRLAEEALRQSQKMEAVGQLTGGVAHDFNNLLTVIRSSTDLLQRPDLPEARRQRYVAAISDTVTRAARLTGQLLAFARRQTLRPEVFDAGRSIAGLSEMIGTLTGSRIRIETQMPEAACLIDADPSQFDTAIVNMAVNARDAMDGEGRLTIGVRAVSGIPATRAHPTVAGDFVSVSITDTGAGIAPADLDRIFEPFFTTKEVGQGTGLGLSQVFGFAKQSGGEVRVESAPGRGTTFTLYLPRSRGAHPAAPLPEVEPRVDGHGTGVLMVEDNLAVGAFTCQALSDLGYRAVWTKSAQEALAELARDADRFDVVFSDVVMPGIGGVDLALRIRAIHPGLPVVLTSGYSHVLAQGGTRGFELLHKPYSIDDLSRILSEAASRRRRVGTG